MKIKVIVEIEAPEGATHYFGNLLDEPVFVKMTMVGVVGEHWWYYGYGDKWCLLSHYKPHTLKELQPEIEETIS